MNNMKQFNQDWVVACKASSSRLASSGAMEAINKLLQEDGAYQIKLLPIPLIFNQSDYEALTLAAKRILDVQHKLLAFLLEKKSQAEILEFFGLTLELEAFIDWDNVLERDLVIARFDVIPSEKGYAFCEFNYGSPIGGSEEFECFAQYLTAVGLDYQGCAQAPRAVMADLLEGAIDEGDIENIILLVMSEHRYLGYFSLETFKKHLEEKYPHISVSIEDESSYPEKLLEELEGEETLVYRVCVEDDVKKHGDFFTKLFASGATVISGFESEIFMSKRWLSLLHESEYQALLSQQELEVINQYVPFTTTLKPENFDKLLSDKDAYVFKSETSFGGKGTIFGLEADVESLRETLERTGIRNWIAQALVEVDPIDLPYELGAESSNSKCSAVLGLYLIGEEACGMNIRVSHSKNIVNVSSDARSGWAFPMCATEKDHLIALMTNKP